MKIGVIVETLRQPLKEGIRTAAELGCQGIQFYWNNKEFNLLERTPEDAEDFYRFVRKSGLEISAVTGDLPGYGFGTPGEVEDRVEKVRRFLDMARRLHCHVITNHIGVVPADPGDPEYAVMAESLGRIARYAESMDSCIAIETGPEPSRVLKKLLEDVKSPGLGINLDPANLVMVQNEDAANAVRDLTGHIVHTHAKDGIHLQDCNAKEVYTAFAEGGFDALLAKTGKLFEEVPLGHGQVRWDAYLDALKTSGYDGFLTIEREVGADPKSDIAMAVAFLRKKLSGGTC